MCIERERPLVFGLGFHKTGTSSLGRALEQLGYRVRGVTGHRDPSIRRRVREIAWQTIDSGRYDAFQDNPWPLLYQEIDRRYPGSKFVLTVRDPQAWIASLQRHFGTATTPMRAWIYGDDAGCPLGNEQRYLDRYRRHNDEVRRHFRDRPGDFVEMNFAEGDGWDELCGLLHARAPKRPWPHANAAADRERGDRGLRGVWKGLRQRLQG